MMYLRGVECILAVIGTGGPVKRSNSILTMYQSDAISAGIFSQRTNQTPEARVYSHNGPIRRQKRGYILTTDQSDARRRSPGGMTCSSGRLHAKVLSVSRLRVTASCPSPPSSCAAPL
eukprot:1175337-Prorocentrum_minimum.AAC.2